MESGDSNVFRSKRYDENGRLIVKDGEGSPLKGLFALLGIVLILGPIILGIAMKFN